MIRIADWRDLPGIEGLMRGLHAAKDMEKQFRADYVCGLAFVEVLLSKPDSVVFVAERDGVLTGVAAMTRHLYPYSGEQVASEMLFYSRGGEGVGLLKACTEWAKEVGASRCIFCAQEGDERFQRFLGRFGYEPVETAFVLRF